MNKTDLIISGAGAVGATLAYALKDLNLSITLIDPKPASQTKAPFNQKEELRMIALSLQSIEYLEKLGLWASLKKHATPIKNIHVSEQKQFAHVLLKANQYEIPFFGAIIALSIYERTILEHLQQAPNVTILHSHHVTGMDITETGVNIRATDLFEAEKKILQSKLVVAADGADSLLKQLSGIPQNKHDYDQVAVIANICCEHPHHNTAYERFSQDGPLALLPIDEHQMAMVLTFSRDKDVNQFNQTPEKLIQVLYQRFGQRLGKVQIESSIQSFPLHLSLCKWIHKDRLTLLGNSAHALHPIAGQGLNLGLRDIQDYHHLLQTLLQQDPNLQSYKALNALNQQRKKDIHLTVGSTDFLLRIFSCRLPFAFLFRGLGLGAFSSIPYLQSKLVQFGMGFRNQNDIRSKVDL